MYGLTLSGWGMEGGGGGRSARADFNFRERPCYLRSTHEMLPLLLKFIGEQDFGIFFCQGITCYHDNPLFDAMFSQILTFYIFSFNY